MSNDTLLLIEPKVVEGDLALSASYGSVTEGCGLGNLVQDYEVQDDMQLFGPNGALLEVHFCKQRGLGPIFIKDQIVFGPIFITMPRWEPLHCDACARIILLWIAEMQDEWKEKYHGEWRTAYGQVKRTEPQRLN